MVLFVQEDEKSKKNVTMYKKKTLHPLAPENEHDSPPRAAILFVRYQQRVPHPPLALLVVVTAVVRDKWIVVQVRGVVIPSRLVPLARRKRWMMILRKRHEAITRLAGRWRWIDLTTNTGMPEEPGGPHAPSLLSGREA